MIKSKIRIRKQGKGEARHRTGVVVKDHGAREFEKRNERRPNPVGIH